MRAVPNLAHVVRLESSASPVARADFDGNPAGDLAWGSVAPRSQPPSRASDDPRRRDGEMGDDARRPEREARAGAVSPRLAGGARRALGARVVIGARVALAVLVALGALGGISAGAPGSVSPPPAPAGKGVIVLVRHAERAPSAMTDDAPLTDAGKARAERLAALLAKADVKAIFVTRFRRTQETARPLAERLQLTPIEESDTDHLVAKLRAHGAETVLVVGHSDTVPDVIRAFGGPPVTIADDEFDALFVLEPATGALVRLQY